MGGVTEAETRPMEAHVTETVAMPTAMPMDGVTETKAEALPKEDVHDGDKDGGRWMA